MAFSIFVCIAAFFCLVWLLRKDRMSLGLPIAYLFALLLIHVPGAIAHLVGGDILTQSNLTELGIRFTAIGAAFFVVGVWVARFVIRQKVVERAANRFQFWVFCLVGGWIFTYGLTPLRSIPSLGAALDKGGVLWMLGVMLGLRAAVQRGDIKWIGIWLSALLVYPVLMLLLGGFLSYGSTAIIIVVSVLAISTRNHWRVIAGATVAAVLAFHVFLSYFENRDQIREATWGEASIEERLEASATMFTDFKLFDPGNETQLNSLDLRLNQNHFVGLAATRIEQGQADYLHGRSLWEGFIALVPRAIWPDKPVKAGSGTVVSEVTGLVLSETTSFGIGNVMEFHINFGVPGLVFGFLLLGWLLGVLDRKAAMAETSGDLGKAFLFFLPAVALIQPNGSMVELVSGSAAALLAAYGWRWLWRQWSSERPQPLRVPGRAVRRIR